MAGRAIRVTATSLGWIGSCVLAIGSFVLMVMVTEVFGCGPSFVLAIARHCRPAELQRHEHQQKNCQPFTHMVNSVAAIDFSVNTLLARLAPEQP